MVRVSRSGRRNMSLSNTRAKPSTDEPSNHSPLRMACGSRCTGMVILLTVPSTSTKRKSRNRTPRPESRSSARSVVCEPVRLHTPPRALVAAPGFDQVGGEDAAAGQVVVVDLERVEHFHERAGGALHLALHLGLQFVEVFVDRLWGVDLFCYARQCRPHV